MAERAAICRVTLSLVVYWRGSMTLEQALMVVDQLSVIDRLRLIEKMVPEIQRSISEFSLAKENVVKPRVSSLGILAYLGNAPSEEEIDEVQREMWAGFGAGEI